MASPTASRACARLLRQNSVLRESIAREFAGLESESTHPTYAPAMREYEARLLEAAAADLSGGPVARVRVHVHPRTGHNVAGPLRDAGQLDRLLEGVFRGGTVDCTTDT